MGLKPVPPKFGIEYERHRLHLAPGEAADPRTLASLTCAGWEYRITVPCGWPGGAFGSDVWFERAVKRTPAPTPRKAKRTEEVR
jgi:hypothetical protein